MSRMLMRKLQHQFYVSYMSIDFCIFLQVVLPRMCTPTGTKLGLHIHGESPQNATGATQSTPGKSGILIPSMYTLNLTNFIHSDAIKTFQVPEDERLSFPPHKQFWEACSAVCKVMPESTRPPHFVINATNTKETIIVNQSFCRRFVAWWEQVLPHVVKIHGPNGSRTFCSSEEFWTHAVLTLADSGVAENDASSFTISSSRAPCQTLRATPLQWENAISQWDSRRKTDEEKLLAPEPKPAKKKHRPMSHFWLTFMNEWNRGIKERASYL